MRKFIGLFVCLCLLLCCVCCAGQEPVQPAEPIDPKEGTSLLTDKKFRNGFSLRGLGEPIYPEHAEEETTEDKFGTVGLLQYGKNGLDAPVWTIAQWSTRYSLHDALFTSPSEGVYRYENTSKLVQVDTSDGSFTLGLKASECYVYGDRVPGQEWPHLLIERDLTNQTSPSPFTKVSDKQKILVSVKARLDAYEDKMTVEANPGVHAAQLMYYLFISHRNPQTKTFDDMIWLGLPVFDNRSETVAQADFVDSGSKGSATERYIYNLGSDEFLTGDNNFWKDGRICAGEDTPYVSVAVDVLPCIRTALERAQAADCMQDCEYENLYVSGMYIGFELPGTYDIQMSFQELDIRVV